MIDIIYMILNSLPPLEQPGYSAFWEDGDVSVLYQGQKTGAFLLFAWSL